MRIPLAKISQFIVEMRRRHVFRVTGIYIVTAWVILQVADLAFESFGLPTEAMRFVWYALIAVSPLKETGVRPQLIYCSPSAANAAAVSASYNLLASPGSGILAVHLPRPA